MKILYTMKTNAPGLLLNKIWFDDLASESPREINMDALAYGGECSKNEADEYIVHGYMDKIHVSDEEHNEIEWISQTELSHYDMVNVGFQVDKFQFELYINIVECTIIIADQQYEVQPNRLLQIG